MRARDQRYNAQTLYHRILDIVRQMDGRGIRPLPFLARVVVGFLPHRQAWHVVLVFAGGAFTEEFELGHRETVPVLIQQFITEVREAYFAAASEVQPNSHVAIVRRMEFASYRPGDITAVEAYEQIHQPWLTAARDHWADHNGERRAAQDWRPDRAMHPWEQFERTRWALQVNQQTVPPDPAPPRFQEALRKSLVLLLDNLSAPQKMDFLSSGYFDVAGQSGQHYRIFYGTSMNIVKMAGNWPSPGNNLLCIVPEGGLPVGDVLLCQKLALELEEALVIRRGNWFPYGSEAVSVMQMRSKNDAAAMRRMMDVAA